MSQLKVSIKAFDVTGKEVRGVDEFQYLDLSAKLYDEFGQKQPIIMPDVTTRSFSVECTTVVFEDGEVWEPVPGNKYKPLPEPTPLAELLGSNDLVEQYRIETTLQSVYVPTEYEDIWVCSCGCANSGVIGNCRRCRIEKSRSLPCWIKSSSKMIWKCGSTSLSGNKKGYGIGKGVIGAAVFGPIGLIAGNIGSKKVIVTCMNCGYKYKV